MEKATRILNALSALVLMATLVYVQATMGSFMSDSIRVQTGLVGLGWIGMNCWAWFHDGASPSRDDLVDNP